MWTVKDILEALTEQGDLLKTDKTTNAKANAMCNVVGKMVSILKLQADYNKSMGKPKIIQALEIDSLPAIE